MKKEETHQHLSNILGNVASIRTAIAGQDFGDFIANEQTKEAVYSYLQEIGRAAFLLSQDNQEIIESPLSIDELVVLRNARYNQEAEINHHAIWAIIKGDLETIANEIEESELYTA